MAVGAVGKMKKGEMASSGAPTKKPSIPAAKSVKASGGKNGKMGIKGGC